MKRSSRRTIFSLCLLALICSGSVGLPSSSQAQRSNNYPNKQLIIVVPFAPGAADVFIRALAPALEVELGQPIVIENRPGANGAIAAEFVKRAAPDGYTLLMAPASIVATRYVMKDTNFDLCKDFIAVGTIHESPLLVAVYPGLGINSVAELIEQAKRNPGKMTYGSAGIGSVMHLSAEVFKRESKTDLLHVPYKGAAVYIPDLIAGRLDLTFSTLGTLAAQIADKKLTPLAVLGKTTHKGLPGVPSINDTLPSYQKVASWSTIVAPLGLPEAIRSRLHQAIEKALASSDIRMLFEKNHGATLSSSSPDDVAKLICTESELLDRLTRSIGIQPN